MAFNTAEEAYAAIPGLKEKWDSGVYNNTYMDPQLRDILSKSTSQKLADSSSGDTLMLSGTAEERAGAAEGLQFGKMLYGQSIGDVGKEAADYSSRVKGRLDTDYAGADLYRQEAAKRVGQANVKAGLSGVDTAGASEQLSRQAGMQAGAMNQDYKDKALALYGRNVSSKQQGLAGQYMAGKGIGQANTPGVVPNYSSSTFPCFALVLIGLMSNETYASESSFVNKQSLEYIGYAAISGPIVYMILKNGLFAKTYSYFAHKYIEEMTGKRNTIIGKAIKNIGTPFCKIVGSLC